MTLEEIFSLEIKTKDIQIIDGSKAIFTFEIPGMVELKQCEAELNQDSMQWGIYGLEKYVKCEAARKYLIEK